MLRPLIVWLTCIWAVVFVPIETYLDVTAAPSFSEWAVNVFGIGIALWGVARLRQSRAHADSLLATGWGWTKAVFWRGTNLRYLAAGHGEPLYFGRGELWFGPLFTVTAGAAKALSLMLLLNSRPDTARADVLQSYRSDADLSLDGVSRSHST